MERVRLTPSRIEKASCPPGKQQAFLWDSVVPRLAVRSTSGAKSFVFEGKLDRRTIRITIGDVRVWNIEEVRDPQTGDVLIPGARQEARRLQSLIDQGIDPRQMEKERLEQEAAGKAAQAAARQEAEDRRRFTLRALCDAYVKLLEDAGKTKSAADARSAFKCHVLAADPVLAGTSARDVTSLQITKILRKVTEKGKERTAGVLRSYLSAAFNAAKKAPFDAKLPSSLISFQVEWNPADPVAPIPVRAGQRHLAADELKAYIGALGDDLTGKTLKLALYAGGQRIAQLLRAKVSDYDPQAKTLRLFDSKGKRTEPRIHLLPLGPVAAGIVAGLVKQADRNESPFLLSSRRGSVHESTPGKRVKEISQAMGGESFDLRDIRRTCETMLAGLGISRDIRAQLLSHGISGVQAVHYDRHAYVEEKRQALLKWERYLDSLINGKKKGQVVSIR